MNWKKIKNIRGLKTVSQLGTAAIIGNAIAAIFWIYLANLLGVEDYGELAYFLAIAEITSTLAMIGSAWTMSVYTAKGVKIEPALYLTTIISSGIATIILYLLFQNIGMSVYVIGIVIFNLTIAELIGKKKYKTYSKIFVIQKIIFVIFGIIGYYVIGPDGVLLSFGLSYIPFMYKMINAFRSRELNLKLLREKFGFLSNNYIIDLSTVAREHSDKLIIAPLFGFALLGNYYLSIQVLALLLMIPNIVFTYTLSEDASGNSTRQIKILVLIVACILSVFGVFVLPLLIPMVLPQFADALSLISIMSIAVIPKTISILFISKFIGQEKSKHVVIANILTFAVLILGIVTLIEIIGVIGVAIAYVLGTAIQTVYLLVIYYTRLKGKIEK